MSRGFSLFISGESDKIFSKKMRGTMTHLTTRITLSKSGLTNQRRCVLILYPACVLLVCGFMCISIVRLIHKDSRRGDRSMTYTVITVNGETLDEKQFPDVPEMPSPPYAQYAKAACAREVRNISSTERRLCPCIPPGLRESNIMLYYQTVIFFVYHVFI